jgi:hypothetical protein
VLHEGFCEAGKIRAGSRIDFMNSIKKAGAAKQTM